MTLADEVIIWGFSMLVQMFANNICGIDALTLTCLRACKLLPVAMLIVIILLSCIWIACILFISQSASELS